MSPARVPTCMHTPTCTHTPAHMHRHIHTDTGATRRHMMQLPCLPPRRSHGHRHWSLTSTETQTHAYIRLFGVSCKRQERREFSRLVVSGRAPRLRCSCLPLLFSILPSSGTFHSRPWGESVTCKLRLRPSGLLPASSQFLNFSTGAKVCYFRKLKGMISSEGPGGRALGGNVSARKAGEGGSDPGSVRSGVLCPLKRSLSKPLTSEMNIPRAHPGFPTCSW